MRETFACFGERRERYVRYFPEAPFVLTLSLTGPATAQAVVILRSIAKSFQDRGAASNLVAKLCQLLPMIRGENARASVYWLGSQYACTEVKGQSGTFANVAPWAPDLLRCGVKGFLVEVIHRQ
jgi:hypothetical protein